MLFSIFFTINVGIPSYFVYYKHRNRNKKNAYQVENYLIEISMGSELSGFTFHFYFSVIPSKSSYMCSPVLFILLMTCAQ